MDVIAKNHPIDRVAASITELLARNSQLQAENAALRARLNELMPIVYRIMPDDNGLGGEKWADIAKTQIDSDADYIAQIEYELVITLKRLDEARDIIRAGKLVSDELSLFVELDECANECDVEWPNTCKDGCSFCACNQVMHEWDDTAAAWLAANEEE